MLRIASFLITFALLLTGCSDSKRPDADIGHKSPQDSPSTRPVVADRKPLEGDVTINFKVDVADRHACLEGVTNLPTGTQLSLSVEERGIKGGFYGQSNCSIAADGSFRSEQFGPTSGLRDGVYVARVTVPIPNVQPPHVQQAIGMNGEKLTGPLVEAGKFGVTASARQEFTIGGDQATQSQQELIKERSRQYREWLNKVVAFHKRLEVARSNDWLKDNSNLDNLAKWGAFARQFREEEERYSDELKQVEPRDARLNIAVALNDVSLMFTATAFQRPTDYKKASAIYAQNIRALEKFVLEAEAASK